MDRVPSIEDRIIVIVEEFFSDISSREPFETELIEFRLRLRAKLLEIVTSFPTDPDVASRSLNQAIEGMEGVIKKSIDDINLDSEEALYRSVKTLETINEILKEFLLDNKIKDKKGISSLSGFIGNAVEKLRKEYKRRFGGFLRSLKRLLGFGRSL